MRDFVKLVLARERDGATNVLNPVASGQAKMVIPMLFKSLKESAHLKLQRFTSPDEFRAIGLIEVARQNIIGSYSYRRAMTALPGVQLMLDESSPRTLEATMKAGACTVIVPMRDQLDAVFNAQSWGASAIGVLRKETGLNLREASPNAFAVIRFVSDMQNRGWDEAEGRLHLQSAGEGLSRLQTVVRHIFLASSLIQPDDPSFATVASGLKEQLIEALDHVLASRSIKGSNARAVGRYVTLISRLDELVSLDSSARSYGEDLAHELGISARTLQTAVQTVHGMSLHQYLRNKRLWALRAQLARGTPLMTVSSVAMANGFWHMGELSRLYKETFGELPSETLLRGKGA